MWLINVFKLNQQQFFYSDSKKSAKQSNGYTSVYLQQSRVGTLYNISQNFIY